MDMQQQPLPPAPQQNKSNSAVMITIIICATVIVLFVLGFILLQTLNKNDEKEADVKTEQVETAATAQPAEEAPAATSSVKTLDVPEGDVKPVRKSKGSLSNVGFTDDYSDIVCYTYLDGNDLAGLSKSQLRILRNTIYARHGRKFKSADLRNYFNGFSWYSPRYDEIPAGSLSAVEKHNISLIQSYE